MNTGKLKKWGKIISLIWVSLLFLGTLLFLKRYFDLNIDDDCGAEMILSKILSEKGGIVTHDWYYSTEIRILNTQLVYGFLFKFISNWHTVRILGNALLLILLLLSVYYLCKQLSIEKYFAFVGAFFIIPLSREYYLFAIHGAYLLPHLIISILIIAMYLNCDSAEKRRRLILWICMGVLSFLAGLGGIRYLFVLYAPLSIAVSIHLIMNYKTGKKEHVGNKYTRNVLIAYSISFAAFVGFVINNFILKKKFDFSMYYISDDSNFTDICSSNVFDLLNGLLKIFGYQTGKSIFSIQLVLNILSPILIIAIICSCRQIIKNWKENDKHTLVVLFFVSGMIMLSTLFLVSTFFYDNRYVMPVSIFAFPIIFIGFSKLKISNLMKSITLCFLIVIVTFFSIMIYRDYIKMDDSFESRKVADMLMEKGYYNGYSFMFWKYGDGLVEYSDGQIEVWKRIYGENEFTEESIHRNKRWLESKSHDYEYPDGKVFLIVPGKENILSEEYLLYENNEVAVYGYENVDKLFYDIDN